MQDATCTHEQTEEQRRIAQLETHVAALTKKLGDAEGALVRMREKYTRALEQLQLMHRRLFVAKKERLDTNAEQLAFDKLLAEVQQLEQAIGAVEDANGAPAKDGDGNAATSAKDGAANSAPSAMPKVDGRTNRATPQTGRRDLSQMDLPEERVEVTIPELEGKAERIGFDVSYRLGYRRGGMCRIVLARVVYKETDATATETSSCAPSSEPASSPTETCDNTVLDVTAATPATPSAICAEAAAAFATISTQPPTAFRIVTAPMPKELVRRGMLAPSMIAYLLVSKYVMGLPFHRLEQRLAFDGVAIDRGTMCRYAEDVGATLGAIVEAMRKEAIATAFCLSTDATGAAIQPTPLDNGKRQPCRKGHFFVTLADRDHVFFDYQAKHTSLAVWEMFKGFSGYIQADAHVIYDALFKGIAPEGADDDDVASRGPPPKEVGCWSHARRKSWEAAVCKHTVGLEGLRRIDAIFEADRAFADLPPSQRKTRRDEVVRPLVDDYFAWVKIEHAKIVARGLVATAIGYSLRQETALRRFFEDGRLRLENNAAERALRIIAVGRKAWMFFGSDDHASAAANLFSLLGSCKLHELDPEAYLADVLRVMPHWPRERYIELAPKYWARTRARLDIDQLKRPLGHLTVPPPLPA